MKVGKLRFVAACLTRRSANLHCLYSISALVSAEYEMYKTDGSGEVGPPSYSYKKLEIKCHILTTVSGVPSFQSGLI